MGLLSWLFPNAEDKLRKARRLLSDKRYAEARLEVLDLDLEDARILVAEAEVALVRLNLEKALQRARSGDLEQYQRHLDLATSFHDGGQAELFDSTRQQFDLLQEEQAVGLSWDSLDAAAIRRQRLGTDPGDFTLSAYGGMGAIRLFFGEDRPFNLPGLEFEPTSTWFKPHWLGDDATQMDLIGTGLKSAYPPALSDEVDSVLDAMCQALGHHIDCHPEMVVQALRTLPITNPVVAFELGRAACGLGQHDAAILAFEQAIKIAGSDLAVDGISVCLFQAAAYLWNQDLSSAAKCIAQASPKARASAPHLVAVIAIENGDFETADQALENIEHSDRERPQLVGAYKIRKALQSALDDYPIIMDEQSQGSVEWNSALETVLERLGQNVEDVINELKAAADDDDLDGDYS